LKVTPGEVVTDAAAIYPAVLDELIRRRGITSSSTPIIRSRLITTCSTPVETEAWVTDGPDSAGDHRRARFHAEPATRILRTRRRRPARRVWWSLSKRAMWTVAVVVAPPLQRGRGSRRDKADSTIPGPARLGRGVTAAGQTAGSGTDRPSSTLGPVPPAAAATVGHVLHHPGHACCVGTAT
jgi:hypothetical protein